MEAEYIALYQSMRDVLTFVINMKDIEFVLKLKGETPMVLCFTFEKSVIVYEDNQGSMTLMFLPQIWPHTKYITIKYHNFRIFVVNGDVDVKHVDTKEYIADIFMKPLYSELFGYLHYKFNGWWVNGNLLCDGFWDYAHEAGILLLLY